MEQNENQAKCQIACVPQFFEGYAPVPRESILRKLKLLIRRNMSSKQVRLIKMKSANLMDWMTNFIKPSRETILVEEKEDKQKIKSGEYVRVRSEAEIRGMLNYWGQLKGCTFMPEMRPYCGTTQRVLKRVERFVDERDYSAKKTHGIILLEGVHCQGTADYGRCDRACFYFWREEWLEKIPQENILSMAS